MNTDKKLTNTDPKSHLFYFNGDSNLLVNIFFSKVKPIEGIVKYKMVNWDNFPKTIDEAKKLSLEWVGLFNKNKSYEGMKVIIYFHLEKKTIRFELKKIIKIVDLKKDYDVLETIKNYNYEKNQEILFNCENNSFFNSLKLDECKILAKNISNQLETIYNDKKFVVFFNLDNKSIKITTK